MSESGWGSGAFAGAWKKGADARNRLLAAATERMFAEARVVAGARVLDLGTGTGDTALLAAERVGPSGSVVATDSSAAMADAAAEAVRAAGARSVTVRVMDASAIDLPPGSFDAVIARHVLMFLDLPRALAQVRNVLRTGGRIAAIVSGALERNPFQRAVIDAAQARGARWGDAVPQVVRAFPRRTAEGYGRALAEAGFGEVSVYPVGAVRRFASAAEAVASLRDSPIQSEPIARLPEVERESAWADVEAALRGFEREQAGGACEIPVENLIVAAEK